MFVCLASGSFNSFPISFRSDNLWIFHLTQTLLFWWNGWKGGPAGWSVTWQRTSREGDTGDNTDGVDQRRQRNQLDHVANWRENIHGHHDDDRPASGAARRHAGGADGHYFDQRRTTSGIPSLFFCCQHPESSAKINIYSPTYLCFSSHWLTDYFFNLTYWVCFVNCMELKCLYWPLHGFLTASLTC